MAFIERYILIQANDRKHDTILQSFSKAFNHNSELPFYLEMAAAKIKLAALGTGIYYVSTKLGRLVELQPR